MLPLAYLSRYKFFAIRLCHTLLTFPQVRLNYAITDLKTLYYNIALTNVFDRAKFFFMKTIFIAFSVVLLLHIYMCS